jgi:uncharacterized protein DUF5681
MRQCSVSSPEASIEQMAEQAPEQDRPSWRWKPGQSGNPRGRPTVAERKAALDAEAERLAADYGGLAVLSNTDRARIEEAAALRLKRPRRGEDRVRTSSSINKLLNAVEHHHRHRRGRPTSITSHWLHR